MEVQTKQEYELEVQRLKDEVIELNKSISEKTLYINELNDKEFNLKLQFETINKNYQEQSIKLSEEYWKKNRSNLTRLEELEKVLNIKNDELKILEENLVKRENDIVENEKIIYNLIEQNKKRYLILNKLIEDYENLLDNIDKDKKLQESYTKWIENEKIRQVKLSKDIEKSKKLLQEIVLENRIKKQELEESKKELLNNVKQREEDVDNKLMTIKQKEELYLSQMSQLMQAKKYLNIK